jgi:hypothetical protein
MSAEFRTRVASEYSDTGSVMATMKYAGEPFGGPKSTSPFVS